MRTRLARDAKRGTCTNGSCRLTVLCHSFDSTSFRYDDLVTTLFRAWGHGRASPYNPLSSHDNSRGLHVI